VPLTPYHLSPTVLLKYAIDELMILSSPVSYLQCVYGEGGGGCCYFAPITLTKCMCMCAYVYGKNVYLKGFDRVNA
jgi:hypothetical protein